MNLRHDLVGCGSRLLGKWLKKLVDVGILLGVQEFVVGVVLLLVVAKVENITLLSAASNGFCYYYGGRVMLFQALHGVRWGETLALGWGRDQLTRVGAHVHRVILIIII